MNYKEKLLNKILDRIVADIDIDIYRNLEELFTELIKTEGNRELIQKYLKAGISNC